MNNILLTIAIVSMLVTVSSVGLFIWRVRKDRQYRKDQDSAVLNPVIREAERLKASLGPLMEQVIALSGTIAEGQERSKSQQEAYDAKLARLEEEIKKRTG